MRGVAWRERRGYGGYRSSPTVLLPATWPGQRPRTSEVDSSRYDGRVADDRESTARWLIGISIAVVGILISAIVTLVAADRLDCPSWFCRTDAPPAHDEKAMPALRLDPPAGPPGTRIDVRIDGFGANETVTITLAEVLIATLTADENGTVASAPVTIPASFTAPPGRTTVTAFGRVTHHVATADFTIVAA